MLLLLPVAFVLIWLVIAEHRVSIGFANLSNRGALVLAFLAFELLLLTITEITSVYHHFTMGIVAGVWSLAVIVLLVAGKDPIMRFATRLRLDGSMQIRIRRCVGKLGIEDRIWLGTLIVIFGVLAFVGFMYLPSNPDSLVYHLARVEHWIQNRTIAPYAAHYLAQIEFPPLAEYNLALLHLLSGTDRFDASVELLAAVVSVVGVSELARLLRGTRSVQILASVLCATIPSGILLATSTENDYLSAAVGIGLLVIVLSLSLERRWIGQAVALGASMGLAYVTKSTIPAMLGPAVVILLAIALYRFARAEGGLIAIRRGVAVCSTAAVCALIVVAPFVVQTFDVFGSPVGPKSASAVSSQLTIDAGAANVIRSVANNFHIGNGSTGIDTYVSKFALDTLRHGFNFFHVSPDDARYSETPANNILVPSIQAFTIQNYGADERNEDLGANPWDVILVILSAAVLLVAALRGARELRSSLLLAVGLTAGYAFFSFISKWGIYDSRYYLPLLVAWSCLIAVALSRFPRWVGRIVMIALLVACLPQLLDNATRPLVRPKSYGASYLQPYFLALNGQQASAYETVTASLAQSTCERAAIGNVVIYEYPLWVGLQHNHWSGILNDFDVDNKSRKLEPSYRPCAWISQEGPQYVTPNNGTINMQLSDLALSIDADRASTIRTTIPSFDSDVRGVRVFPGGDWSLTALDQGPLLGEVGSIYISSTSSRLVQLQLQLLPHVAQPSMIMAGPGGTVVPKVTSSGMVLANVGLHAGMNRVDLTVQPNGRTSHQLPLHSVTIAPA